jgi:pyridoxine 4-dehydrogenase
MPKIIPIPGASSEKRVKENSKNVTLTDEEMKEIQSILDRFPVSGGRYHPDHAVALNG